MSSEKEETFEWPWEKKSIPSSATKAEKSDLVTNQSVYSITPLTHGTSDASKPPEQNEIPSDPMLKSTQQLQTLIRDQDNTVPVFPMLLTVTGFPKSGKTQSITKALKLEEAPEVSKFSHYEFVASGFRKAKKIQSANIQRDHSFRFAMEAGLMCNFKTAAFGKPVTCNDANFGEASLNGHIVGLAEYLQERQDQDIMGCVKRRKSYSPDSQAKAKSTQYLEASLNHGVGLINVWDVSINESIGPLLETLGSCFTTNRMWLFIDLERDFPHLHLPIDEGSENDSPELQWRPRVQQLLRMCQICKFVKSKDGFKRFCMIFAIYSKTYASVVDKKIISLRREIQNAAVQMGVEELIEFEIKSISLDLRKIKPLRKAFKSILYHLEEKQIPLSWVFLRSSLIDHKSFYITHEELKKKAHDCEISPSSLDEFCKFFTSYGSIFDIRMIDKSSDYIVVKPFAFLSHLEALFQEANTKDRIMSVDREDNSVVMQILSSVSLALERPYLKGQIAMSFPTNFYCPLIQKETNKVNRSCIPGAVQLILSMESPRINMAVEVAKQLCKLDKSKLVLNATEYVNTITIETNIANIMLTFQGDITEIHFPNIGQDVTDSQLEELCFKIAEGLKGLFAKKAELFTGVRYHFAIRCKQDALDQLVAFNAYRKRHVLPNGTLCDDCKQNFIDRRIIKAWNSALEKSEIPKKLKLNGDLTIEDITMLATEIIDYPWNAICMLAEELNVKIYRKEPKNKKVWLVLGMLMEWEGKRRKDDESAKKVLARNMIKLDSMWTVDDQIVDFKKLARKLDIQVLALDEMKKIWKKSMH